MIINMLKIIFKLAAIVLVFAVFGVFGFVVLAIPLVLFSATRGVESGYMGHWNA